MLDAKELSFQYRKRGPRIIDNLTLTAHPGEVLAILGPNARGKTTLLKCLSGLLKPTGGTVAASGGVGYVPQSHSTVFSFPVLEMVLMGRARAVKAWSAPSKADHASAQAALDRVGLSGIADREFSGLSGGQRQLVLVARALASGADTIVLDEPASALDMKNQAVLLTTLRDLADEGMAVVMTTHHPDHALHIAERSLLMADGKAPVWGRTRELLTASALSEVYGVAVTTADVECPSAVRRITVTDYGKGVRA
jgi:iron complex transport system ATP-binding protein